MIWVILALLAGGGLYVYTLGSVDTTGATTPPASNNPLPDTDSASQGGEWSKLYDDAFTKSGERWGIPFALLKAHAIRESALNTKAYRLEPTGKASYGLMQILWWPGSNRFARYGYNDDLIRDGSPLYDPYVNTTIAAQLMKENISKFGNLRDAVNAYNTGVSEASYKAPNGYVDDVLGYYSELVGRSVT